ncbi:MAG: tRNA preQ1(34) S-adenosylmethionine ribosyltransferase-isomerase QueA [Aestuariivita sp.]|nr:tRNA preQ1(34) S-adenosylmethionine ribosyltransferase-isomerase QueA [Aestuariivita sp.]MCY4201050.1 tRNA preQ1(34) S-adenosylmethionine ribosyltransferase-isomerase QueA [Aestuariivita sp.]MCY4288450.1 tRNA preQ1(34) S-adenosylmethionine ribosyltransferase-isomerase QueA [Aestuariivita sp.]MCY4347617.1 tRNA preQ1(34) S-adenosylmethionine ribosyltransferase-isomerase QueA [Aestuariivita sp.]
MNLQKFDFNLPAELIATRPVKPRSSARLLVADRHRIVDSRVADLPKFLNPGDRLVLNDTRVLPTRMNGRRKRVTASDTTYAKVEVTLIDHIGEREWHALMKPLKKIRVGESIYFSSKYSARVKEVMAGKALLEFNCSGKDFDSLLRDCGMMPLPPYIQSRRKVDQQDLVDYQSVFARHSGAVAAPTASLHFDQELLTNLQTQGVEISFVTLHVGAGTFLPLSSEQISKRKMYSEWGNISEQAAEEIMQTKSAGNRIIPVGTTALRLIETVGHDGIVRPWSGKTRIFISPGFKFRVADALMTNFHLPQSSLIVLVCALMGRRRLFGIYDHATNSGYRFFSYGDSSLLCPNGL